MARRRMFSNEIIDTDLFADMPLSTQALYFKYGLEADDDGFVSSPKMIRRMIGASEDDINILIAKRFVIPFASGVILIRHWCINNQIRKDRYVPTIHIEERNQVVMLEDKSYELAENVDDNQVVAKWLPSGCQSDNPGKVSKDKNSPDKESSVDIVDTLSNGFDMFWMEYPRKIKKSEAKEIWDTLSPDGELVETIITALKEQKRSTQWQDKTFIPYPTTWLSGKRWEDEISSSSQTDMSFAEKMAEIDRAIEAERAERQSA